MHLFHLQCVQALHSDDYVHHISFAQCYPGKCATVLFTDETIFTRENIFIAHNAYMCAKENSHVRRRRGTKTRCLGRLKEDPLIGPYLLPFRPTGSNYLLFLQQVFPQLLGDEQIFASMQKTKCFQHDIAFAFL